MKNKQVKEAIERIENKIAKYSKDGTTFKNKE